MSADPGTRSPHVEGFIHGRLFSDQPIPAAPKLGRQVRGGKDYEAVKDGVIQGRVQIRRQLSNLGGKLAVVVLPVCVERAREPVKDFSFGVKPKRHHGPFKALFFCRNGVKPLTVGQQPEFRNPFGGVLA